MAKGNKRFTVFDMMEAKGDFESNAANAHSDQYKGPVPYPKMFYHPKGEERITQRADIVVTPLGAERHNEKRELIWRVANTPGEEQDLRAAGWHDHPTKAMKAAGKDVVVHVDRPTLEAQLAAAKAELKAANARLAAK